MKRRFNRLAGSIMISALTLTSFAPAALAAQEEPAVASEAEAEEEITCIGDHYTIEVNGVSLYYEVAGEGKPVVLVHGNGGNHKVFHVEIQQLVDAGYQVYALDSRGQGENEPLDE
ncbi:MAG: alpha/beta fold hydrolase [Lachnospiraceae bacterium]|nr:alpha/beta fold hydrolase [Robinsoniella sp.]MDY3766041.1 alpha/beta fold hydrolase [Lachnospiraceae bacterium]